LNEFIVTTIKSERPGLQSITLTLQSDGYVSRTHLRSLLGARVELQRRDSVPESPESHADPVGGTTGPPEPDTAIWPPPAKGTHESDLGVEWWEYKENLTDLGEFFAAQDWSRDT
jgi:hypothetical protein